MDVPAGPRKSDYLYTNFLPNFPLISIPFSEEKHPIWIKLGAFYNNLPKIHPIYVIWAPSSLMKTPRSLYQISRKGAPKGRHIYVYHVNVRTPPGATYIVRELWYNHMLRAGAELRNACENNQTPVKTMNANKSKRPLYIAPMITEPLVHKVKLRNELVIYIWLFTELSFYVWWLYIDKNHRTLLAEPYYQY